MTDWNQYKNPHSKVVELLPAGGKAKRIAPLPCSKELFPVSFQDSTVVFGFPDIIFQPDDAFTKLLAKQAESSAQIVLGLFPAHQPHKMDMADMDSDGRVLEIPNHTKKQFICVSFKISYQSFGFLAI